MTIYDAELADDYGQETERSAAICGLNDDRWDEIEVVVLESFAVLSFFDPPGFRFHLPAYMVLTLDHCETGASLSMDFAIYALNPGKATDAHYDWHMERYAGFTGPQRAAVVAFLRWCRDFGACDPDYVGSLDIGQTTGALEYWTARRTAADSPGTT
ncbi:MAG: hypothetical protein ACI9MR_002620 [Myxococcota bacterium]|jgi:hypothetical protein